MTVNTTKICNISFVLLISKYELFIHKDRFFTFSALKSKKTSKQTFDFFCFKVHKKRLYETLWNGYFSMDQRKYFHPYFYTALNIKYLVQIYR